MRFSRMVSCTVAGIGAPCAESEVTAADRRLRRAYDRAIRSGVPRPMLVDYRDRWADLRDSEGDRPDRLARDYGDLTRDLGQAADDARTRPVRRTNRLRADLLSWW